MGEKERERRSEGERDLLLYVEVGGGNGSAKCL